MHTQLIKTSRVLTLSAIAALTIGLADCGTTTGERSASGAGVGAAVGAGAAAATGGSVTGGAALGAGVGAATGALTDEDDINLDRD